MHDNTTSRQTPRVLPPALALSRLRRGTARKNDGQRIWRVRTRKAAQALAVEQGCGRGGAGGHTGRGGGVGILVCRRANEKGRRTMRALVYPCYYCPGCRSLGGPYRRTRSSTDRDRAMTVGQSQPANGLSQTPRRRLLPTICSGVQRYHPHQSRACRVPFAPSSHVDELPMSQNGKLHEANMHAPAGVRGHGQFFRQSISRRAGKLGSEYNRKHHIPLTWWQVLDLSSSHLSFHRFNHSFHLVG